MLKLVIGRGRVLRLVIEGGGGGTGMNVFKLKSSFCTVPRKNVIVIL